MYSGSAHVTFGGSGGILIYLPSHGPKHILIFERMDNSDKFETSMKVLGETARGHEEKE